MRLFASNAHVALWLIRCSIRHALSCLCFSIGTNPDVWGNRNTSKMKIYQGLLFSDHPHTVFETHMMASTVASPYNDGRGVLRQIFGPATWDRKMSSGTISNTDNASRRDILTLFKVCSVISGRSAMMAAVMIVSMVRQILSGQPERKEIVIPVYGTVYKSFPKYKERLNDHLMSLVQAAPDIPKDVVVVLKDACEDGSCIGAAAVLAAACREDNF